MNQRLLIILLLVACVAIGTYLFSDWYSTRPLNEARNYVGRDSCVQCHQAQATLFHGSDHDLAMDLANDETVLADFNNQQLEHYGITSRMYRDGKKFMVQTDGPDGKLADFEVKYVFGVRPLQQYMVEIERPADAKPNEIGRIQVLRNSWDTVAQKWFYLMPPDVDERLEATDPLHWTGITQNWNTSCAACHSTNLQKNFDVLARQYRSTFSEIDVSCEACHGPGSLHVELANDRSVFWDRHHQFGLARLKSESNIPQIESCAPCHSRRTTVGANFRPGCSFDDYYATQLLTDQIYHADGQIRDEDYEYGSFIQSKMFHNGIRCTDCHDPHSTKVKFDDNSLCTSCHQHPAGKYDSPSHHHHEPGTPGASCVECHMPATTYMMVDARHDHSLRVPRPDLSVRWGTPNSCTGCHLEPQKLTANPDRKPLTQYLDWIIAAETGDVEVLGELNRINLAMLAATDKWYPVDQSPPRTPYYEQLVIGRAGVAESLPTLNELARDRKAPAIFRASALSILFEDACSQSLETAVVALADSDAKVIAAALFRIDMEFSRIADRQQYGKSPSDSETQMARLTTAVAELLTHASRRVRIEAARVFVSLPPDVRVNQTTPEQRRAFELALDEYKQSLYAENDRAGVHMMLGGVHELLGDPARAKDDYRAAVSVEPNLAGPRANLAALLESEALQIRSQLGQAQSSGGLEAGQLRRTAEQIQRLGEQVERLRAEEHALLAKDLERSAGLEQTHGLHYRFAMSSYVQRDLPATEKHLLEALRQQPNEPTYLLGLATYYIHIEKPEVALGYVQTLLKQDPQHPGYRALLEQINAQN